MQNEKEELFQMTIYKCLTLLLKVNKLEHTPENLEVFINNNHNQ